MALFVSQVEVPSQFMENWLYDKTTMNLVSGHYQTGEKLPDDLFQQVFKGKQFSVSMNMYIEYDFT